MKALILKEINSPLVLEDRPSLTPASNEVVVQLRTAALNRRDYWITKGMYPGIQPPVVLVLQNNSWVELVVLLRSAVEPLGTQNNKACFVFWAFRSKRKTHLPIESFWFF